MQPVRETIAISAEQQELATLEKIFEQCQSAWKKAGAALNTIREKKLYKLSGYKTWPEYLDERWGIGEKEASKKIIALKTVSGMQSTAVEDSSLAENHAYQLSSFPPDMRDEIYEVAKQTAPGGKLTAPWIEQTGRRLMDARLAQIKEAEDKERLARLEAEAAAKEDEGEASEETEEAEEQPEDAEEEGETEAEQDSGEQAETKPRSAPAPSRNDRSIRSAATHDITQEEQIKKWEAQAKRWVTKGERLALSLNCTVQDLFERFGS